MKLDDLDTDGKIHSLSENMKIVTNIGLALLVSLFFVLSGMVMNSFATKSASYQNLQDDVQSQNTKIDQLTHELELQRIGTEMSQSTSTKP